MRVNATTRDNWSLILSLLTPANRLAVEVALSTGLRVSDVLNLTSAEVAKHQRLTVTESKTGRRKRVYIGKKCYNDALAQAGKIWLFPSPKDEKKHRTRQAVWADLKRAQKALRLPANIGTHSARKSYACDIMRRTHDIRRVQRALGHSDIATTLLYILDIV